MELVEGPSLRGWMGARPVPPRKAVAMVVQIAQGLAAAHDAGIVHRDLKPENVLIGKDGRPRILDFGLAKLFHGPTLDSLVSSFGDTHTEGGKIVGTVGYMAPEQLGDGHLDGRSDIFALGIILWEMLARVRPFQGASAIDTMHAILRRDLPELDSELGVPAPLERVLRRCLEKEPANRFQNARDLAFALDSMSSNSQPSLAGLPMIAPSRLGRRPLIAWAVLVAAVLSVGAFALLSGRIGGRGQAYKLEPILPFPMTVTSAKFMPDGKAVIFSAAQQDGEEELYLQTPGEAMPRVLGVRNAHVLAVSRHGEIALDWNQDGKFVLAMLRAPGQAPKVIEDQRVWDACWDADGKDLIKCYFSYGGQSSQAYVYKGKVLYQVPYGYGAGNLVLGPGGKSIYFEELRMGGNFLIEVGLTGDLRSQTLQSGVRNGAAIAGGKILGLDFETNSLCELKGAGRGSRDLMPFPGTGMLFDGQKDGTLLLTHLSRMEADAKNAWIWWKRPDQKDPKVIGPIGAFDYPVLAQGGDLLGCTRVRPAGFPDYDAWLLGQDTKAYTPIGRGILVGLSEKGDRALTMSESPEGSILRIVPTGAGNPIEIPGRWVRGWEGCFFDGGRQILMNGLEVGSRDLQEGSFFIDATTGHLKRLPFRINGPVSRDGKWAFLRPVEMGSSQWNRINLETGERILLPPACKGKIPVNWGDSGREVWVVDQSKREKMYSVVAMPIEVSKVDLATGRVVTHWTLTGSGVRGSQATLVQLASDGQSYAFSEYVPLRDPNMLYRLTPAP
jgi:hypothetical protein